MKILRLLALVGNVVLLILILILAVSAGFQEGKDFVAFFGLFTLVVANIYIIWKQIFGDSWLGLFLKRKSLEERRRIVYLERTTMR